MIDLHGLPELWTSRFANQQAILDSGLVPVRITVGHPRFRLRYQLAGTIPQLAPDRDMITMTDRDAFAVRYCAKVEAHLAEIVESLRAISDAHAGRGIVVLCFEDIRRPNVWCHREILAEFLSTHNVVVKELADIM